MPSINVTIQTPIGTVSGQAYPKRFDAEYIEENILSIKRMANLGLPITIYNPDGTFTIIGSKAVANSIVTISVSDDE